MIKQEDLDFCINNGYNLLLEGKHGVGKTFSVLEAFNRHNLNWRYFSAATLDPWVDLIGIPKEAQDEHGNKFIELVRPKEFAFDEIEAIFFDELNRSHKKVTNAVMELIQFKSINGKKFKNLKIIWAAINPGDDENYDTERLDAAVEDRFHMKIPVPYKLDGSYFTNKYGRETFDAVESWWNQLPPEQKDKISPRRVDYALEIYGKNGNLRHVVHESCNVSKLITTLKDGPIEKEFIRLVKNYFPNKDEDIKLKIKALVSNENKYEMIAHHFNKEGKMLEVSLPLMPRERISKLITKEPHVLKHAVTNMHKEKVLEETLSEIVKSNSNKSLVKNILEEMRKQNKSFTMNASPTAGIQSTPLLSAITMVDLKNTHSRRTSYERLYHSIKTQRPINLMTIEETLAILSCIDSIKQRSHNVGFVRLVHIIDVITDCFKRIKSLDANIINLDQLITKYVEKNTPSLRRFLRTSHGQKVQI